jgi:hypothetical protein
MAELGSTLVLIAPESNATLQLYTILASFNDISGEIVFLWLSTRRKSENEKLIDEYIHKYILYHIYIHL